MIYDPGLSDDRVIAELVKRARAGVRIKIIGKLEKKWHAAGLKVRQPHRRLHVRAMVRDGRRAFIGSQSLRRLELDERREVGILIREKSVVADIVRVFKSDWKKAQVIRADQKKAQVIKADSKKAPVIKADLKKSAA